jgi:hypothetical protein
MAKKDEATFLKGVREWFRRCDEFESAQRSLMLNDIKFVRIGGEYQWPDYAISSRKIPGQERPVLTDNRLKRYRTQVINQIRQNSPAVKVRPVDDHADPKTAEALQGIIRNIESRKDSDGATASDALDKAVEYAVDCGRGFFALRTDYESADSFEQGIQFRLIPDPFKVYFDPWSIQPDGSDARKAMIIEDMPRDDFERAHKDVEVKEWELGAPGDSEWLGRESIRLAEYYEIVETASTLCLLPDGTVRWEEELTPVDMVMQTRKSTRKQCRWWKIAGNQILEGGLEGKEIPSRWIPIIPVYGEEFWVEGEHHINGLVRSAKDPATMFNFWLSALAEQVALQPKAPWVGPRGFMSDPAVWASSNTKNVAALEYEPYDELGNPIQAPSRQPPPPIPTGYVEQMQVALDGIRAAVGMEDPSVGKGQSGDQSGRAIRSLQQQSDISTFHFADNLAKSVAHAGRIMLDMIPRVYDTRRVLRILGEDGEPDHITHDPEIQAPMMEERDEEGGIQRIYNVGMGRYDCIAQAGPSYNTKREGGFDALMQFTQAMPQLGQLAGDLIMKLSDIPYSDQMAKRLKAGLPPHIAAADEEEADPQLMAAQAQIEQLTMQLQAVSDERALKEGELNLKAGELEVKKFDAETKRIQVLQPPEPQAADPNGELDVDERLARLMLEIEEGQRKQEAHEREMATPVPASNTNAGGAAITGD